MTTWVAVLGAGGFVGRSVVRVLAAEGHRVLAVSRQPTTTWPDGVEARLLVDADWAAAVRGAEVVVHLVARTHQLRETPDVELAYRAVNVEMTRSILAACVQQEVRRLVYVSSVKAMGESRPEPYREDDDCRPMDAYGRTKLEAEHLVRAASLETVVLRPPLVYGRGARGNVARLLSALRRGIPLPLGRATARRSLVAVDNLADAVRTAAMHRRAAGRTFLVSDREVLSVRGLVEVLAEGLGRPARLVPVPVPLLRAGGRLLGRADEVDRLVSPLTLDISLIQRELGWRAPESAYDALRRAAGATT